MVLNSIKITVIFANNLQSKGGNMKLIIFTSLLFCIIAIGCGSNQGTRNTAGQIISNSWEGEDILDEKNTWITLRPPVIITKTDTGDVIALFNGEFNPMWEADNGLYYPGGPIELRIKVNDVIASPTSSEVLPWMLGEHAYETRSFLASLRNLPPGTHTVTAEWRCKDKGIRVRNRTLTVWETVRTP